jgi:predicted metal-dependent peptidase
MGESKMKIASVSAETQKEIEGIVYDAILSTGWLTPAFMCLARAVKVRATYQTPTAAVDDKGQMIVNPEFFASLSPREIEAVAAHECAHIVLAHVRRMVDSVDSEDWKLWNIAADLAINEMLGKLGFDLPDFALKISDENRELREMSVDQIFDWLKQNQGKELPRQLAAALKNQSAMKGCGYDGERMSEDVKRAVESSLYASKCSGKNDVFDRVFSPPVPRAEFEKVLLRFCSFASDMHRREEKTFKRRSRRSYGTDFFLPGDDGSTANVLVLVDTSGSMTREMLEAACKSAELAQEIVNANVTIAFHDVEVYHRSRPTAAVAKEFGRIHIGGTCFESSYRQLEDVGEKFDVCLHVTDCYDVWPARPNALARKFVVASTTDKKGPEWAHTIKVKIK